MVTLILFSQKGVSTKFVFNQLEEFPSVAGGGGRVVEGGGRAVEDDDRIAEDGGGI